VPGRFERITYVDGVTAVVDYSHTPDSLLNALRAARTLPALKGRIITVFGCGGDRDHGKRPMMGGVASENSDVVVVTSDNPRTEDPGSIIEDILAGVTGCAKIEVRVKREAAIRHAIKMAAPGDVVLVAGKGHETYQILGKRKIDFDDHEVVRRCFQDLHGGVKK
jgi:UDP-N-acetylmuramoyl-L-alanyl-D-glutamate--2,6-diaminopimelate ligase